MGAAVCSLISWELREMYNTAQAVLSICVCACVPACVCACVRACVCTCGLAHRLCAGELPCTWLQGETPRVLSPVCYRVVQCTVWGTAQ